jgi:thiamine-monophosphate kinase
MTERAIIDSISGILGEKLDDDCAYMKVGGTYIALTIDSMPVSTHVPEGATPEDIGWHSIAVSLSDLASSGADPECLLLSIVAPRGKRAAIPRIIKGAKGCASHHSTRIAGGDTKEGEELVLTSVGIGRTPRPVTRAGARPGDSIYVTGTMGRCAAGFLEEDRKIGARSILRIAPRTALAGFIRSKASACIDLSDGLITSLYHLSKASGCSMKLSTAGVPLDTRYTALALGLSKKEMVRVALNFGGDYELLFTSSSRVPASVKGVRVTHIGKVTLGDGVIDENRRLIQDEGYENFSDRWIGKELTFRDLT